MNIELVGILRGLTGWRRGAILKPGNTDEEHIGGS